MLAVCDIRSTETTAVATHVLPVAGQLERADLTSFLDLYFPFPFAQYGPAAVPAHPGRPPMWRIFAGLGRRLGLPGFADVERRPTTTLLAAAASRSRVPWAELVAAPSGVARHRRPAARLADPGHGSPAASSTSHPPSWSTNCGAHGVPPEALLLVNGRRLRQANSVLRDGHKSPTLVIHPDDATRHGAQRRPARRHPLPTRNNHRRSGYQRIDPARSGLDPPRVDGTRRNALTSGTDAVDLLTGMPLFTNIPVTLEHPLT